ncbi:MAG TPA: MoxR family ATPase [Planctomycetes bacterium]|nr:MoxR family ATPase [Planctomycetota bacterium]
MHGTAESVIRAVKSVIVGKDEAIRLVVGVLLARGHVLITDRPGVGKTTLARALARALGMQFTRVQFTPDLLPSDILGVSVYEEENRGFRFHRGPVFTNVMLADEINRATPRTQSALLEAMNENEVSTDGETHRLPDPFFVVATQNPLESVGTYPLPVSELDRFTVSMSVGYPGREEERQMVKDRKLGDPLSGVAPVADASSVTAWQEEVRQVDVADLIVDYVLDIVAATRGQAGLGMGASPRATLHAVRMSQAMAYLDGRSYVVPDDVKRTAVSVLAHRLSDAGGRRGDTSRMLREILERVPVPV